MNSLKAILAVVTFPLMLAACSQNKVSEHEANEKTANAVTQTVTLQNDTTNQVFSSYNALKDALVASNADEAQKEASELATALSKVSGSENPTKIAHRIASSIDLAQQRADFTNLSDEVIALMKKAQVSQGTIFIQYCPMANAGKGGYWMAADSEVRNPYYGDEMLNCGEVKEEIKSK
ncbi:MAG TPA: DUF3347 domain-containing protein [Daejeonella sp.]|nr:DUF3347 domain-containing protein [Daejeonella sp.]